MIRKPISTKKHVLLGVVSVIVCCLGYTALSYRQHKINPDDKSIPTWTQMYQGVKSVLTPRRSGEVVLIKDLTYTGARVGIAVTASVAIGFVIGMLGCFSSFRSFVSPVLAFLNQIPPTAVIAVFFVLIPVVMEVAMSATAGWAWLNSWVVWAEPYSFYIAIVGFSFVPSLAERMHIAIRDVPDQLIYKAYTLGASHLEVMFGVIYRQILPRILEAILSQIGPAMVCLIAAEALFTDKGFGYRIKMESRLGNMDVVFPYLIMLAMFGFGVTYLIKFLQHSMCRWFSSKS